MANIDYDDLEELTLNMEDEDGVITECELQFVFEYENQDYGAFCEPDNETGEFYFFSIDASVNRDGETELEIAPVENEDLLEKLVEILQQIIDEDLPDSLDDDEEDDDDEDEDDSRWDEFIHKTLDES